MTIAPTARSSMTASTTIPISGADMGPPYSLRAVPTGHSIPLSFRMSNEPSAWPFDIPPSIQYSVRWPAPEQANAPSAYRSPDNR